MEKIKKAGVVVGRIIVGLFYIQSGIHHFTALDHMAQYASSMGVPLSKLAVIVSGLILLAAGLSILLGFKIELGVLALILFFIPVSLFMHPFWKFEDPQVKMMQSINFMKNMALMGSALIWLGIPSPIPLSLEEIIGNKTKKEGE